MRIEFLEEGSEDCPLIRIFGTDQAEFGALLGTFTKLSGALGQSSDLHRLPNFQSDCLLTAISTSEDRGVERTDTKSFVWSLTPAKWLVVEGLTEPFSETSLRDAHQWLSGREARFGLNTSGVSVVLSSSADGRW
jgi:hypothetical protein